MYKIHFYGINRGELAIVACKNGEVTAQRIKESLEEICRSELKRRSGVGDHYYRELQFRSYSTRNGIPVIGSQKIRYSDGEVKPRLHDSVAGKDVYIVQNTLDPQRPGMTSENLVELILTVNAAKLSDAAHVTVVLPYLSYSKQERMQGREPVSAKLWLETFALAGADRLMTMDLHAPAIQSFVNPRQMITHNLYATSPIIKSLSDYFFKVNNGNGEVVVGVPKGDDVVHESYIQRNFLEFKVMFGAPDAGAAKMVEHYARVCDARMAMAVKIRRPDEAHKIEATYLLGEVEGYDVVITDDQIATGGTVVAMAKELKRKGARNVYAAAVHGLFLEKPDGTKAADVFRDATNGDNPIIKKVFVTDTLIHSESFLKANSYIEVVPALGMLGHAIYEVHCQGSLSRLYDKSLRQSLFGAMHRTID